MTDGTLLMIDPTLRRVVCQQGVGVVGVPTPQSKD